EWRVFARPRPAVDEPRCGGALSGLELDPDLVLRAPADMAAPVGAGAERQHEREELRDFRGAFDANARAALGHIDDEATQEGRAVIVGGDDPGLIAQEAGALSAPVEGRGAG